MALKTNHHIDDHVDEQIQTCLKLESLQSFFLFAGAGSGKTSSLVKALEYVNENFGQILNLRGQKVAVITYTNAACDEIISRTQYNKLFDVSTIHSFAWELIKPYTSDIKERITSQLNESIIDLEDKQSRSRGRNKSFIDRERKIESRKRRLANLKNVRKFTYNPNGENKSKDSLNHSEVIDIASFFLNEKRLMQSILVRKYPILLVDESQDTNKHLVEALFNVEKAFRDKFCLGLIGDMMQRIYLDGKASLGQEAVLEHWKTPAKKLNHRCPARIVKLINKVRELDDGQQQEARTEAIEGTVRLFVIGETVKSKKDLELEVSENMASITKDDAWKNMDSEVQKLTLEHHMVASRMGFSKLFEPLYEVSNLKTGIIDGTNSNISFFIKVLLPLYEAFKSKNKFALARICKDHAAFLSKSQIESSDKPITQIKKAQDAVVKLCSLWDEDGDPTLLEIIRNIENSKLFILPETLSIIAGRSTEEMDINTTSETAVEDSNSEIDAWDKALNAPFSQLISYNSYITEQANFATHQGVKGREFPRVMVILDDNEAKGFLFSYEKLFGVKPLSDTDKKNIKDGKESGFDRTLKLFYVTCSRAKESLAIVAYTENPELLIANVVKNGWFTDDEIVHIH